VGDEVPANSIARWNGSEWSPLGEGIGADPWDYEYVHAILPCDGGLIAAGSFTVAGGAPASRIARWDGSSWNPLGWGMDDYACALCGDSDQFWVGGWFTCAGDKSSWRIARWVADPSDLPEPRVACRLVLRAPNPYRANQPIRFVLPEDCDATVSIYDVGGRRVRRLHTGMTRAGELELTWDGRAETGRSLGSGIYWVRAQAQPWRLHRMLVLLR
jgi:hypothetical protein